MLSSCDEALQAWNRRLRQTGDTPASVTITFAHTYPMLHHFSLRNDRAKKDSPSSQVIEIDISPSILTRGSPFILNWNWKIEMRKKEEKKK
jgi:hypothetical protein